MVQTLSLYPAPVRNLTTTLVVLLIILAVPARPALAEEPIVQGQLDQVVINSRDVFATSPGKLIRIRKLVNRLHWETREKVIRREVWIKRGDPVKNTDVRELERNLRALDLFATVSISTRPSAQGKDWVDLVINTRDRLSLIFSGSGSFLGGIGSVKFSAGESNLFGLGQRLEFGYSESTNGELRGSVGLSNVLLYGTDVYGSISLGQTEEGEFAEVTVRNRFKNLLDRRSWSVKLTQEDTKIDYYRQGVSIAEVPRSLQSVQIQSSWRSGANQHFWRFGPSFSWRDIQYGEATGSEADTIQVPEATERLFLGGFAGFDRFAAYQKVTWLDTLKFQQDLSLGFGTTLLAGFEYSDATTDSGTEPLVALESWTRHQIGPHDYLGANIESSVRFDDGSDSFWSLEFDFSWYNTRFDKQTIAINLKYKTTGNDNSELPSEQSLGENNGLRGYPAREFNGEQSVLLNMENRIRTPFSIASFDVGVIGFFDAGWVNNRNQGLHNPHSSVGIGLRIGSRAILGRNVVRIDLAYPLDDDPVRDYQPTVSLAVGQVFDFTPD